MELARWTALHPRGQAKHLDAGGGGWLAASPPDPLAWFDAHQLLYDRQDPNPDRRYKAYGQMSARRGGWSIRKGALFYGPDPWTWTHSQQNPIIDPTMAMSPRSTSSQFCPTRVCT